MSDPKSGRPKDAAQDEKDKRALREKSSGRVTFDSRGNAVWEWQTSTGVYGRDVDTKRLRKLEATDLKLLETQGIKPGSSRSGASGGERFRRADRKETGFDPYNSAPPESGDTDQPKPVDPDK
jgi:hypothetical protein